MLSELNIPFYSCFIQQFSKGWKKEPPNQTIKVRFSFSLAEMVGFSRRLSNSNGLRLLIFPQPLSRALKNQNAAPNNSSLFLPQAAVVVVALG